ncbi:hypothetical protein INR49_007888, partial [Caranx melampygus]
SFCSCGFFFSFLESEVSSVSCSPPQPGGSSHSAPVRALPSPPLPPAGGCGGVSGYKAARSPPLVWCTTASEAAEL